MSEKPNRSEINWGSVIGWLIFLLLVAGGPIARLISRALGGTVTLPSNWLPLLVLGLVVLSVIISAVRAMGNNSRAGSAPRLPPDMSGPDRPPASPMPPFGGPARSKPPAAARAPRAPATLQGDKEARLPSPPRFEPIIDPLILGIGIMGLVILGGAALVMLGFGGP